jgi:S1-C subfamily serine protease
MLTHTIREISQSLAYLSIFKGERGESFGTGYVVSRDGHILTCGHVAAGAKRIEVTFVAGSLKAFADVVDRDEEADLALLRARDTTGLKAIILHEGEGIPLGSEVAFMGFPFSDIFTPPLVMTTRGIVGNRYRMGGIDYYVLDAMLNEGFSGGPLFLTTGGEVVGTVSSRFDPLRTKMKLRGASELELRGLTPERTNIAFAICSHYGVRLLRKNRIAFKSRRMLR